MNSAISHWKQIKKSGHFKRSAKKKYLKILQTCSSRDQPLVEVACNSLKCNEEANLKETILATVSIEEEFRRNVDQHDKSTESVDINNSDDEKSNDTDDENVMHSEIENRIKIKEQLKVWATSFNISHSALRELFGIWNLAIPNLLPVDPRTFLNTPQQVKLITVENGTYWHNGLESNLRICLEEYPLIECVSLNINMDGLPIYKSSKTEFWPILCNIHEIPEVKPIVIGIYSGTGKPSNINSYLRNFVDEAKQVLKDGIFVERHKKKIQVKIRCFIADSPARAFIKGVANFNAKHGCLKCTTIGEYSHISHTVYFPKAGCDLRTDEGFRKRIYGKHHKTETPLEELDIDMVEDFPVGDSLHLIDLGVMKRCLTGWRDGNIGNYSTKWCANDIKKVSKFLLNCKMPSEIHRVVRGLDTLAYWKGTEYRTFLLYVSIVILKDVLSDDVYEHFLLLFCATTICSTEMFTHFLPLAKSMLEHYVELYRDFYGEDYMTSNIHNLLHLTDEVKKFGVLSSFNAYPFESRLFYIKKLLRNGNCPLSQIAKRLGERLDVDRYQNKKNENIPYLKNAVLHKRSKIIKFESFSLNSTLFKDKWFLTLKNQVVSMSHALLKNNIITIYGCPVVKTQNLFERPIKSSYLNIYKSDGRLGSLCEYLTDDVKCKLATVIDGNDLVFIPLLHTYVINEK